MHKYLACAFLDRGPRLLPPALSDALARQNWSGRWSAQGLLLFGSGDLPVRLLNDRKGLVVGHLFDRSGAAVGSQLVGEVGAEAWFDRVWGSYVALAQDEGCVRAVRDPSGGLACYHAQIEGIHYFTSVPHLLIDCGLLPAEIDWGAIAGSLSRRSARLPETALRGLGEVLPGTLLSCDRKGATRRQVWDPWRHAAQTRERNAPEALQEVLRSTLQAWARCAARPLIEVSGGLDSAVVAAGLAPAAPGASLITFAAAPGDPDETAYARAIAEHLGVPIEIAVPRIEDVDLTRSLSRDLPRPNARAFTQAADAQSLRHGQAIGADAFVSGGGGDDVFCYLRTVLPALDRLQAQGWRAMAATARDVATMNHSTFWEALSRLVRRLVRGGSGKSEIDTRFISSASSLGSAAVEPRHRHPLGPPGKTAHVRGILTIHNYLEGHARAEFAPILSPLLSQPIVECCLSIPTWLWCEAGQNRAVARRAFAGRLPEIVLERRSKGSFDAFCARLLYVNHALVREMLLDGRLAAEGLLDREAVAGAMRNPSPPAETVARLLALVDIESWVSAWTTRPPQRV